MGCGGGAPCLKSINLQTVLPNVVFLLNKEKIREIHKNYGQNKIKTFFLFLASLYKIRTKLSTLAKNKKKYFGRFVITAYDFYCV
jgi:hypothetical protein